MNDFKILLQAVLDANSINQSDIDKIQKVINKYHLNLTADLDKASVIAEIKKIVPQLEAELKKMTGVDIQINDSALLKAFNQIEKQAESTAQKLNKIQLSTGANGTTTAQIEVLRNNFTKLGLSADEVKNKMNGVDTELRELQTLMSSGADNSVIVSQFDKLQTVLSQTQNNLKTTRSEYGLLATEQQRLSLANTIEAWNQKNTAATAQVRAENDRYVASLRDLNTQMTKMQFGKIQTSFKQAENSMRGLNKLGASLTNQWKQATQSFTMWLSASTAVMKVVSETRQAFEELKEINTILTEISKANENLTKEQLAQIGNNSFDVASKYGKTASNYLLGVQEASRAGYENAEAMAELSTAIQGAGDVTSDVANSYVIATDKAYKLGGNVEALTEVFDGTNKINKNGLAI